MKGDWRRGERDRKNEKILRREIGGKEIRAEAREIPKPRRF